MLRAHSLVSVVSSLIVQMCKFWPTEYVREMLVFCMSCQRMNLFCLAEMSPESEIHIVPPNGVCFLLLYNFISKVKHEKQSVVFSSLLY